MFSGMTLIFVARDGSHNAEPRRAAVVRAIGYFDDHVVWCRPASGTSQRTRPVSKNRTPDVRCTLRTSAPEIASEVRATRAMDAAVVVAGRADSMRDDRRRAIDVERDLGRCGLAAVVVRHVPSKIWPAPSRLTMIVSVHRVARAQRNSICAPVFIHPRSLAGGEGTAKTEGCALAVEAIASDAAAMKKRT